LVIYTDEYGQKWPRKPDPLKIEFNMIRRTWKMVLQPPSPRPSPPGEGEAQLLKHYLNARKLIWPDRYCHRWSELIYREIIKNSITILMGAASSQKTAHASEFSLIDYWVYPDETAVLVSSTTRDKLEDAVWGEMKSLWKAGKENFPWLAGHMIEYKQRIATDDRAANSDDVRDLRKGVFCKACYQGKQWVGLGNYCFPKGTPIDTPSGPVPIEQLKPRDQVWCAAGLSFIESIGNRMAEYLVRIHFADGRQIDCTPDHPFFTSTGWVNAVDLDSKSIVLSLYETLQILREGHQQARLTGLLQHNLFRRGQVEKMSSLSENVSAFGQQEQHLFKALHDEIEDEQPGICCENAGEYQSNGEGQSDQFCNSFKLGGSATPSYSHVGKQPAKISNQTLCGPGSWSRSVSRRTNSGGNFPGNCLQFLCANGTKFQTPSAARLLSGFGVAKNKIGRGSGRGISQNAVAKNQGPQTHGVFASARVDRLEILGKGRGSKSNAGEEGHRVYNIQVARHPSYSVNGLIVHNSGIKQKRFRFQCDELQFMSPTFLACLPNMRSNTGAGGLKVIGSGNPRHDPNDQLGIVAEPLDGWPAVDGLEKTTVWPIKLLGGACVNLIGLDSPNFDQPDDKYRGLIGHTYEKIMAHDYGKNSPEYETQIMGRMRIGLEHSRVITRQLCRLHQAHDKAIWDGKPRTRIYSVDPAYGGGDRCVGGWIEFGEGMDGTQLLRVNPPRTLKIVVNPNLPPEDQIADLVKEDLEQNGIPPENCFYDSFGKGTVGFAFARKFGFNPPVPVDAGALTTQRPVRYDLWVTERDGRRRLKQCNEHYSKFITEMWFSVRETIESNQMRELPEDVMAEGCWREYQTVAGDKIEVEPKDDLKERMGKSPDLFDWLAIALEGARQRGFKIKRLGADVPVENSSWDWFMKQQDRLHEQRQKHALTF
jgi:hypothetical protein